MIKYFLPIICLVTANHCFAKSVQTKSPRITASETSKNANCAAPGVTYLWELAYCGMTHETDDYENPDVQNCAQTMEKSISDSSDCEKNKYVRRMTCLHQHKANEKEYLKCEKSFIPKLVKNGIGQ